MPVDFTRTCPKCKESKQYHFINASVPQIREWHAGALIQDVMPDLSPVQREVLITGYCEPCQDILFAPEGEEL